MMHMWPKASSFALLLETVTSKMPESSLVSVLKCKVIHLLIHSQLFVCLFFSFCIIGGKDQQRLLEENAGF